MTHADSCFYAAIGLTSQGDGYALTQHMLGLMQTLTFITSAAAYEVYPQGKDETGRVRHVFRRFSDNLNEERVAPDEPGLADSACRRMPVEVPAAVGTRLVFPVESERGPLRLMVLEGQEISPEERVLLLNLVTLYRNQVNVLDGKERDSLTGLLNRHTFDLRLMQVMELRRRNGGTAWLGALDIDHFKRVNDTYGHLYGDEVLLHFAQLMQRHFRYTDFLFRFGGEEFIVLLTNTCAEGAAHALDRFRQAIADYAFPAVGQVTVSIGYAAIEQGILPTTVVDWADRALYRAKETGRNRVVSFTDIREAGETGGAAEIELF